MPPPSKQADVAFEEKLVKTPVCKRPEPITRFYLRIQAKKCMFQIMKSMACCTGSKI